MNEGKGDSSDMGDWTSSQNQVPIKALGRIVTGSTPPKARSDYYGGSFPLVKPGELRNAIVSESKDTLTELGALIADVVPAGSILVSCIGNLGKTALTARPLAFNQQINAIVPHQMEHGKWIFYAVQAPGFINQLNDASAATTIAIVNKGNFSELTIPQPQEGHEEIVDEIEKQFTRLEAGIAALRRAQANLKRYRASVLKAACEGRLVPTEAELARQEGRDYESGERLLARTTQAGNSVVPAKRAGRLWGAGHVPDLTAEERLGLPAGWAWVRVYDVGTSHEDAVQVGPMSMRSDDFVACGVPVFNVGCVQWDRFVESKLNYLPTDKAAAFERYRIRAGDVLFTRSGTVGRCAVAQERHDGWLMTFHLLRARPDTTKCLPKYLRTVFEGASHVARQTREASVGSTRAGFNTNLLGSLSVPLPPFAEQERIVAEVERRLSVADTNSNPPSPPTSATRHASDSPSCKTPSVSPRSPAVDGVHVGAGISRCHARCGWLREA